MNNALSDGPNIVPLHSQEVLLRKMVVIRAATAESLAVSTL